MNNKKEKVKEWLQAFVYAALVALIMFVFIWPAKVDGISMENTLHHGDRLFISRFSVKLFELKRGDIVVCKSEKYSVDKLMIKRVIGLPGDSVLIKDGKVFINGSELAEDYLKDGDTDGFLEIELTDGEYFVMGDNRHNSSDSRDYGPIKADDIQALAFFRFYPFDKVGSFEKPEY